MDGEKGVDVPGQLRHLRAQGLGAAVPHHRVHVDGGLNVVLGFQLPLDMVDHIVNLQEIAVGRHLGVEGHHGPAGAVVVIYQVVDTQDVRMVQHKLVNVGGQRSVHGPAQ